MNSLNSNISNLRRLNFAEVLSFGATPVSVFSSFKNNLMIMVGLCLILLSTESHAKSITVKGQGIGATKAKALLEAKRDALAKGIGQNLVSKTEVENFMVQKDQIISQTMGHIKAVKIISETKSPEGYYQTKIEALVSEDGLKKDLAALLLLMKDLGNPRIAFIIEESNMGSIDKDKHRTVETALTDFFKERQFEVVDANQVLRLTQSRDLKYVFGGDAAAAALLGAEVNADVIIVGTAIATESDMSHHSAFKNTSMKSASAQLNLRAINVSSQRILAAGSKQAAQVHPNKMTAGDRAFKKAVKNLMSSKKSQDQFFGKLVEAWRKSANDGQTITITVAGIKKFSHIKQVKFFFQNHSEDVTQRKFYKPNLDLDIKYAGSVESLCESLDGGVIDGVGTLSVDSYQGHSVQLSIK
tara:strand:- start:3585 stop:4826 length:1242 start_codon:yes stop_codon:yes gene_type:complete